MGLVLRGLDAPVRASVGVGSVEDALGDRVTHGRIVVLHVNFESEDSFVFIVLSTTHFSEFSQIFFNRTVAPDGVDLVLLLSTHCFLVQVVDLSISLQNQLLSLVIQMLEIVTGVSHFEGGIP